MKKLIGWIWAKMRRPHSLRRIMKKEKRIKRKWKKSTEQVTGMEDTIPEGEDPDQTHGKKLFRIIKKTRLQKSVIHFIECAK